jgi:hypothetical protein|nr:MAG TPA_asm: helix-turn-helix domain protein [Caudoviricetes sp.]
MAARLTDKQKNKIIADYVECSSYNAVAKRNGVSATTVKNIIKAQNVDFVQKCEQKKEENAADVLAYMESKKSVVCDIIGLGLSTMLDPEKMKNATLSQITTALGTLIDKWAIVSGAPADDNREDALSKSLRELAEGIKND